MGLLSPSKLTLTLTLLTIVIFTLPLFIIIILFHDHSQRETIVAASAFLSSSLQDVISGSSRTIMVNSSDESKWRDIGLASSSNFIEHKNTTFGIEVGKENHFLKNSSMNHEQKNYKLVRGCNLAIGKWVEDKGRPYYSGANCKKWLSKTWACRFLQRKDLAYEKFRWQPKNCDISQFHGSKFLQRMRNKTLAFIGDSLERQQFQSLMCMIVGDDYKTKSQVKDVGKEYGLVKPPGAVRPDGWAYRFAATNTTVIFYWSYCLCDLVPVNHSDPNSMVAMHLDRPPAFLRRFLSRLDVLVLSTGHHWNQVNFKTKHWIIHVEGIPNTNNQLTDLRNSLNFTIHSIVNWVNSQLPQHPNLNAFYRSISPRHFFNGEWYNGGTCDNTIPLSRGDQVVQNMSSDLVAAKAVQGTNVELLDITALSELRDEGHVSKYGIRLKPGTQDCLHWCLPGIPDVWNEILFAHLLL